MPPPQQTPTRTQASLRARLLLLGLSSVLFLLLCEFVLFRFLPVADPVRWVFDEESSLVTFTPSRSGRFVSGLSRQVRYRTNADGWNSLREYSAEKGSATRIAVIGDSYVEAFQVDVEKAFPELIERALVDAGHDAEVYRFGISGAPLSQYVQMLRYACERFAPRIAIVTLIHNDFDPSLYPVAREYWGDQGVAFHTFEETQEGGFAPVAPAPPTRSLFREVVDSSRVLRFLFLNLLLENRLQGLQDRLWTLLGRGPDFEQNVTMDFMQRKDSLVALTRLLFSELAEISDRHGVKLLLIIDAPRDPIHRSEDPRGARVYWFNEMAGQLAGELGIEFLDLTDAFLAHFERHGQRFNPPTDGHWHELGHQVVGREVTSALLASGWLGPRS